MPKVKSIYQFDQTTSNEITLSLSEHFLKTFDLNYFAYLRFFPDGSIYRFCNHAQWTKTFISNALFKDLSFYIEHWGNVPEHKEKQFIWIAQPMSPMYHAFFAANIWNGLSFYSRTNRFLETCSFGADREHTEMNQAYFQHNVEFINFYHWFKVIATPLIHQNFAKRIEGSKKLFSTLKNFTNIRKAD